MSEEKYARAPVRRRPPGSFPTPSTEGVEATKARQRERTNRSSRVTEVRLAVQGWPLGLIESFVLVILMVLTIELLSGWPEIGLTLLLAIGLMLVEPSR